MVVEDRLQNMSWQKESASAVLGGFTPREAARGAFHFKNFQHLPDPLGDPDPACGELLKEVKVSVHCLYL